MRKYWVHPLNQIRTQFGAFHILYSKLREHPEKFFKFYRMSINSYDELKLLIKNKIQKQTAVREPIGVDERLTVTLRYVY